MPTKAELEKQVLALQQLLSETKKRLQEAQDFIIGPLDNPEAVKENVEVLKDEEDVPF